jgi:plastocyanin
VFTVVGLSSWLCLLPFLLIVPLCPGEGNPAYPQVFRCTIPDYVVVHEPDMDVVTIPGGRLLAAEDGRPIVPYYLKSIPLPHGARVQNVKMLERDGEKADSGLKLEVAQPTDGPGVPVAVGTYPTRNFAWKVSTDPDGAVRVNVSVFPFFYDPQSMRVTFFRNYAFEVSYVTAGIAIAELESEKSVYDPGETIRGRLKLKNSRPAQKVIIQARLTSGADTIGTELPRVERSVSETATLVLEQSSRGLPTGEYRIRVRARDETGNLLDQGQALFQIGRAAGEVAAFSAVPEHFSPGDSIALNLGFRNTGTTDLSGEAVFRVIARDSIISEATLPMTGLKPGAAQTFRSVWDSRYAVNGVVYSAIGFVRFAGTACTPQRVSFSTNRMPVASFSFAPATPAAGGEVTFDAAKSSDSDGRVVAWQWDFGDGGTATGEKVTHTFQVPGSYSVVLKVSDNEKGAAVDAKAVVVQ